MLMMYHTIWGRERMEREDQNDNNLWSLYELIYEYIRSCQVIIFKKINFSFSPSPHISLFLTSYHINFSTLVSSHDVMTHQYTACQLWLNNSTVIRIIVNNQF